MNYSGGTDSLEEACSFFVGAPLGNVRHPIHQIMNGILAAGGKELWTKS